MSAKEKSITYKGIQNMNKTEYYKLFKKPAVWKKAQAMICILKHKFTNGKVPLVCIPYKKKQVAQKTFKEEIKKEISPKYILLASVKIIKKKDGKPAIEITPLKGAAPINAFVKNLFARMKLDVIINGEIKTDTSEPVEEIESASGPEPKTDKDHLSTNIDKELQQDLINAFKKQINGLKPDFQQLSAIVSNIKTKKVTAKNVETANDIFDKIQEALILFEQLPDKARGSFSSAKKQLDAAETKVEKINAAVMMMDSEDEAVKQKQCTSLENQMRKLLDKYGIKVNY